MDWIKKIPHGVLPMEQLVLSDKWARNNYGMSKMLGHTSVCGDII